MIKDQDTILSEMISDTAVESEKIRYYGLAGVVRGLFSAISRVASEFYYNLNKTKRTLFEQTATGEDLDWLGEKKGLTRGGVTKSSVVITFSGPSTTIIPTGTILLAEDDLEFTTKNEITLGTQNPSIQRPLKNILLGDVAIAECSTEGTIGNIGIKKIISLKTPITGVTVTNYVPATGGAEEESDDVFRKRIINQINLLNQGTHSFYEQCAKEADSTVLCATTKYNVINSSIELYVVKNSLAEYLEAELNAIGEYVAEKHRAMMGINVYNGDTKGIEIEAYFRLISGDFDEIYSEAAAKLSGLIDPGLVGFGAKIRFHEIYSILFNISGIELQTNSVLMNGGISDIVCGEKEIPRLIRLSLYDSVSGKSEEISQIYPVL